MRSIIPLIIICIAVVLSIANSSCKKEKFLTSGGELKYSLDTMSFDTVFTTLGSFTTQVKIINPQNQKITISSVRIEGPNASYFHLNVDGVSGNSVSNIEVAAKDSIYVFATVKIDPNNINTPFVVEANILATLNGKDYSLPVIAYGQNAHYIRDSVLPTTTWGTDLPYVIINNALVDKGQTLTIKPGCRIYMHADSRLFVDGTLKAIGTKQDSIVFQGDRLDRKYFGNEGYPGEWGGLLFTSNSTVNELDYVILKNCGASTKLGQSVFYPAAVEVRPDSSGSLFFKLSLKNTIIENSIGYGILSFAGAVYAENCLINTCGAQAFAAFEGGQYQFINCDFVTYGTNKVNHTNEPVMGLLNYLDISDVEYRPGHLLADFTNCVVWGSLDNEFIANKRDGANYNVTMNNCLLKSKDAIPSYVTLNNCIVNQDPQFKDYGKWDYHPAQGSPLIDKGLNSGPPADLDGKSRVGATDIGCYEYQ